MENVLMLPFETSDTISRDLEFLNDAVSTLSEYIASTEFAQLPRMSQTVLRSFLPVMEDFTIGLDECFSSFKAFCPSSTKTAELGDGMFQTVMFDESWDDLGKAGSFLVKEAVFNELLEKLGPTSYSLRQATIVLEQILLSFDQCYVWSEQDKSPEMESRNARLKDVARRMLHYLNLAKMYYGTMLAWHAYSQIESSDGVFPHKTT